MNRLCEPASFQCLLTLMWLQTVKPIRDNVIHPEYQKRTLTQIQSVARPADVQRLIGSFLSADRPVFTDMIMSLWHAGSLPRSLSGTFTLK